MTQIPPPIAAAIFILSVVLIIRHSDANKPTYWVIPAAFCAVFSAWSRATVVNEGPFGF